MYYLNHFSFAFASLKLAKSAFSRVYFTSEINFTSNIASSLKSWDRAFFSIDIVVWLLANDLIVKFAKVFIIVFIFKFNFIFSQGAAAKFFHVDDIDDMAFVNKCDAVTYLFQLFI